MRGDGALLVAWLAALVGCAGPPPPVPTSVIVLTPSASCVNDGFTNLVTLSGATSSARLSLMPGPPEPGAPPLLFHWTLSGDEHVIVGGGLELAVVEVVVAGERPLVVELEVDDQLGGIAESIRTVGLTWFVGSIPLIAAYVDNGILTADVAPLSLLACVPGLAGMWVGQKIRGRIDQETFRKALLITLFVIGLNLIRRAVF